MKPRLRALSIIALGSSTFILNADTPAPLPSKSSTNLNHVLSSRIDLLSGSVETFPNTLYQLLNISSGSEDCISTPSIAFT